MPALEGVRKLRDSVMKAKAREQSVEFAFNAPKAKKVCLAGKFNSWNTRSHPMIKGKDGVWRLKIMLPPGRHEFKYFVDNAWCEDVPGSEMTTNSFGTCNYVIGVG